MALLVLVVDRDDDLGTKAGIRSPIIGREEAIRAAEALLISDPEDSDGNTIFAAVKILDELRSMGEDAEIAVVTGDARVGIVADRKIREALDKIFGERRYDGIVFVSDGAEDDQIIPIISSYAPIVSKKTVIVKQAPHLETTFYVLKTALEDPTFARFFLGIPGLLILLWVIFQENAVKIILSLLGLYLVVKGFGLEEPILNTLRSYLRTDPRSPAFPFQLLSWALLIGGSFLAFHTYAHFPVADMALYESLRLEGIVLSTSIFIFLLGKTLEALSKREAYKIGDYIIFGNTVLVFLIVGDALLNFLEGTGDLFATAVSVVTAVVLYYILTAVGLFLRRAPLFSKRVVGAVVVDRTGLVIGRVRAVREGEIIVERGRQRLRFPLDRAKISERRIVVA